MKFSTEDVYLYKWGDLFYFKFENDIGFDAINALSSNQETTLEKINTEFQETLRRELKDAEGYDYNHMLEIEELTIGELRKIQRYGLLLVMYSFFEGQLKALCKKIEDNFKFKIKISDLKGNSDLMIYLNYLIKVYEIDKLRIEQYFTIINKHKTVRNIIAHHNGIVPDEKLGNVNEEKGLVIEKIGNVSILSIRSMEFYDYIIDAMQSFFKEILLMVDERYIILNRDRSITD